MVSPEWSYMSSVTHIRAQKERALDLGYEKKKFKFKGSAECGDMESQCKERINPINLYSSVVLVFDVLAVQIK